MSDDAAAMTKFERLAEAAYDAMYDARPRAAKEFYDEARTCFVQAVDAAKRAGLAGEAARLTARMEHVIAVYNHQFRGVGLS